MKFKSVSILMIVATVSIATMTGCSKKSVPIVPYPTNSATTQQTDTQNYEPYQQGNNVNQAYYGNGAYISDDAGEFTNNTNVKATTGSDTSTSTSTDTTGSDDLGIGDDFDLGDLPNLEPYNPGSGASGGGYTLTGNFPVDQDSYVSPTTPLIGKFAAMLPTRNQWQAVGVAVSGSNVYISAIDKSGTFKKGTVISMDVDTGASWKNLGSAWLGTKYPMDATVKGVALDASGQIYAADGKDILYVLSQPKFAVAKVKAGVTGSIDVSVSGSNLFVATSSSIKKYDSSNVTSGSDVASNLTITGGIGADAEGNVYITSSSGIKKVSSSGQVSDFIGGVTNAIDVAVNEDKQVFVLTADGIKMYDSSAKEIGSFGSGDYINATAITATGKDVYVADSGSSYKDSQVVKYSNLTL